MEEVELSVIEAEKSLELAKEYQYWTSVAGSAKGELRKKAIFNRSNVMNDYTKQQVRNIERQTELKHRAGNKDFNQKLIASWKTLNLKRYTCCTVIQKYIKM